MVRRSIRLALTTLVVLVIGGVLMGAVPRAATRAAAVTPVVSSKVAVIPSPSGQAGHGGTFPESGFPNGFAPTFTNVSVASIQSDATNPLLSYDTAVIVQVCNLGAHLNNATFNSRLVDFVTGGGKLIIWDSECQGTDYSDFVYPFSTDNPGGAGQHGTLTIVEDSTLGSAVTSSPYYVDAASIGANTDAVGDANVMTTFSQDWFVSMTATNTNNVTGPVQTYARLGNGLIIYNGLDMDVLSSSTGFDPTGQTGAESGATNLARIWWLQLAQPWNPDNLPSGTKVFGVALTPHTQSLQTGAAATFSAHVTNNTVDQPNVDVTFTVLTGPDAGLTAVVKTDAHGLAQWSFTGTQVGTDTVQASAVLTDAKDNQVTVTDKAVVEWASVLGERIARLGYLFAGKDGGVFTFGPTPFWGSLANTRLHAPVATIVPTPSGNGYWMAGEDGGVFAFGDAQYFGNALARASGRVTGMTAMDNGKGYWLVSEDGHVYAFGSAKLYGNALGFTAKPIVGMSSTPSGMGYILVNSAGDVYAFGDAQWYGTIFTKGVKLAAPITDVVIAPSGTGYWMVGADGGVFAFGPGAPFQGSMGTINRKPWKPITGIWATMTGQGYWLVGEDGGVMTFGDAPFYGAYILPADKPAVDAG